MDYPKRRRRGGEKETEREDKIDGHHELGPRRRRRGGGQWGEKRLRQSL